MFGISYASDVVYPSSLYDAYKHMPVTCGSQAVDVAVNKYRNARIYTSDAELVKDALMALTKRKVLQACGGAQPYVDVFTGKGSPGAIQTVLEHMYEYREPFIKAYGKYQNAQGECAKLLAKYHPEQQAQEMMQAVCDKYLGLDCSGFVGNFVAMINPKLGGPNTRIQDYYAKRVATRKTADEVDTMDLLIWSDFSHIAIVDGYQWWDDNLWRFCIAQSTGPGPILSMYRLDPTRDGRFFPKLQTAVKGSMPGGYVYAVSLGLW